MSAEINWRHTATGATLYATIRKAFANTMWSTAGTPAFEALTVANWANYKITMTETPSSSYFYVGTFPAVSGNMVVGWYEVDIYSGSAGISDTLVATLLGYWDGTSFKPNADDVIAVGGTTQTPGDVLGTWTSTKAGYLTGAVATASGLSSAVTSINSNTDDGTASVQNAVLSHGDSTWATAAALASAITTINGNTDSDTVAIINEVDTAASNTQAAVDSAVSTINSHGDSTWATATALASAISTIDSHTDTVVGGVASSLSSLTSTVGTPAQASNLATAQTSLDTLTTRLSASRAGYLDNLNVGGAVASHADVAAINQSASKHLLIQTVSSYEQPSSGTVTYVVEVRTFNALTGAAVNADSTPTLTANGQTSGSLAANLGAATNPSTGLYRWNYTVTSIAALEPIRFDVSATIYSSVFTLSAYTQVLSAASGGSSESPDVLHILQAETETGAT